MISIIKMPIKEFEDKIYDKYVKLFPSDERRKWYKIKKSYKEGIEKFYKIELDSEIIGFIMLEKLDNHPYYLEYIGIYDEYQDKGYGTLAMKKLINEVVKDDGIIVEIEQINGNNIQAERRYNFYKNLNFNKSKSEYLLCDVLYDTIYYGYNGTKEELDKVFFDYYIKNNSIKKVKKDFIILK